MRSALNQDDFFKKIKKKPPLQKILDNLDDYTAEELENVKGQPLWIRQQLVKLKKNDGRDSSVTAEELANAMTANSPVRPPAPTYEVRQWLSHDWLMSCGKTGSLKIEVSYGDYLIVYDEIVHKVGLSSSIGFLSPQEWAVFLRDTTVVGKMTKPEFSAYVSQQLTQKHGANVTQPTTIINDPDSNIEDRGLFKIIRHNED